VSLTFFFSGGWILSPTRCLGTMGCSLRRITTFKRYVGSDLRGRDDVLFRIKHSQKVIRFKIEGVKPVLLVLNLLLMARTRTF